MARVFILLALALAAVASPQQGFSNKRYNTHTQVRDAKVHHHHQGVIDRDEPVVPEEYIVAHKTFSLDVLKNQLVAETVEKHGAVSVSPFSIGHFLALFNEKIFNVPTQSITKVLHLPVEKIAEAYTLIAQGQKDDHKTFFDAEVFAQNENTVITPGLVNLGLNKNTLLFANTAPHLINQHVRVATHNILKNVLIPTVPILNKDTTKAVVLNTFQYRNYFDLPLLKVGKRPFQTPTRPVDVETFEVIGTYPVFETETFVAVALPLEAVHDTVDKYAVFVLPKTSLKQYLTSEAVEYVFKTVPSTWVKKTVRVQVPHVNLTIAHNVDQFVGVENLVCSKDQQDQLNPIVQVSGLFIDDEEISYVVATGSQVTSVKNTRTVAKTQRGSIHNHQYRLDTVVPTTTNDLVADEVIINKPFFTYFFDTTYGPFGYTAISHVLNYNHVVKQQVSPFDFTEETKNARFNCDGLVL